MTKAEIACKVIKDKWAKCERNRAQVTALMAVCVEFIFSLFVIGDIDDVEFMLLLYDNAMNYLIVTAETNCK